MPDILRQPLRMDCTGTDLVHPVDKMSPGAFPFLVNVRVNQEGRIESRPGYTALNSSPAHTALNTIRRLNDPDKLFAPATYDYTYIEGNSTLLFAGADLTSALTQIDTGYSGNPLSLIPFRPDTSPVSWMYVYDQNKLVKVRPDGTVRPIGMPPPSYAPVSDYGVPAEVLVSAGNDAHGWTLMGSATGTPSTFDKTNASGPTIRSIVYNSSNTGWCCISITPLGSSVVQQLTFWTGNRMKIVLNAGGGNAETVTVREVHPAIPNTTVAAVKYDSGTSGPCSLVLATSPPNLQRNSLLQIGSQVVRVLAVVLSPDGISYSIRCSSGSTINANDVVIGLISWYTYTTQTHVINEAISELAIGSANVPTGSTGGIGLLYTAASSVVVSGATVTYSSGDPFVAWPPGTQINVGGAVFYTLVSVNTTAQTLVVNTSPAIQGATVMYVNGVDMSKAAGRPISIANDSIHISVFLQNPQFINQVVLYIDVDSGTTNLTNAFTRNYYQFGVSLAQLNVYGPGNIIGDSWTDLVIPLASGLRYGNDFAQNLSNVRAIQLGLVVNSNSTTFGFDGWYMFGTYGPSVTANAPLGLFYASRNRDSATGVASLPGPVTRYSLFPISEQIIVTPNNAYYTIADTADIYRLGNTISQLTYVGSVPEASSQGSFVDNLPDVSVDGNPVIDLTLVQPWPILDVAWSGTVNVVGTTVTKATGTAFNTALIANSVILINGTAYLTFGQPRSSSLLEIQASGGNQTGVSFLVASPTLAGQPLPYAFGPLEGPFSPVTFGLGDPKNPGTVYFTNPSNADAASDLNTLEVCAPSEPLISGEVWNGMCFVGSRSNIYLLRYSYLATIGASSNLSYQFTRLPSPSGMWSAWTCVRGPDGIYFLGRDGIYKCNDTGAVNITDERLYPLFPHDGAPALGAPNIPPVDMTQITSMRLSCCDFDLYFDCIDTSSNAVTWRYEIEKKRWFLHYYGDGTGIAQHYLVETSLASPSQQIILLSLGLGLVYNSGGNTDAGTAITSQVTTPALDAGDERAQKLYVDIMADADGTGTLNAQLYYNNQVTTGSLTALTIAGTRIQSLVNIASQSALNLYRNISCKFYWTGGPAGPRIYAFEPSGYAQPYLSKFLVTQYLNLSFPGWKHHRRLYPALISNSTILFKIFTQDGRTFGPYSLASTGGQYKQIPVMVDHGCKDLAFLYQLDGQGQTFAAFLSDFVLETKEWTEPSYIDLAVFKT